jgi:hypothetical protein
MRRMETVSDLPKSEAIIWNELSELNRREMKALMRKKPSKKPKPKPIHLCPKCDTELTQVKLNKFLCEVCMEHWTKEELKGINRYKK